jgi:putative ABC transport system ATP-binding protein
MSKKEAVTLDHVTRSYRREDFEVRALDDVTLQIPEHSFVAIMGPSGSGKTTMLNLITGVDHPTSGHVSVGGEEITGMDENDLADWRARHIGLVFQFYNLIPVLNAFENVELPLLLTDLGKAERKTHVEAALQAVGLAERMKHYPRQLSGGEDGPEQPASQRGRGITLPVHEISLTPRRPVCRLRIVSLEIWTACFP